ncbi:hypothetical protein KJ039_00320 [bacterium]|nr:hypothetical protein [bacterium]
MQNGVTFWTEGGSSVGMGHVMRCINIAHALESEELPLHFLVNNERPVIDRLNSEALFHITYPITGRHAGRLTGGVVVIDTKRDVCEQVHALKDEGKKVVLIDNVSSGEADAVIMPTPLYRGGVNGNLLSGNEYIIIGENFRRARGGKRPGHSLPFKVLVTMGGSDPFNLTELALKGLYDVKDIEVTAVIGPAFRTGGALDDFMAGCDGRFRFVHNVKDLAPLMKEAHLAFTAMGTTVFELAYMGVPSVLIGNYESDREDLAAIERLGISRSLGYQTEVGAGSIAEAVDFFKTNRREWEEMSARAMSLTDGKGAFRIASLIRSLLDGALEAGEK